MKIELSNGAITASTTDEYKIDARAIDVTVHTTERKSKLDVTYWHKERTMEDYISLRVDIEEQWYEQPEDDKTGRIESAGKLTQFLSLDQARDQVRALNNVLRHHPSGPQVGPVEHSVDLDILAQTIADHINAGFRDSIGPAGYDLAQDILDALKIEFMDQSVHMREDEPVANPLAPIELLTKQFDPDAPTRISDLAGSRLEPGQ
jgi:hypothetical protein